MSYKIRLETPSGDVKWRKGDTWVGTESLADTYDKRPVDELETLGVFIPTDAELEAVER